MTTNSKLDYPIPFDVRTEIALEAFEFLCDKYPQEDSRAKYVEWWEKNNTHLLDKTVLGKSIDFRIMDKAMVATDTTISGFLDDMPDTALLQFAMDIGVVIPGLTYSVKEITAYILEPQHEEYGLHHFDEAYKKIMSDPASAVLGACTALEGICQKIAKDRDKKVGKENIPKLLEKFLDDDGFFIEPEIGGRTKKMIEDAGELAKQSKKMIEEMCKAVPDIRNNHAGVHKKPITIEDPYHASFIVNTVATVGLFLLQNHHKTKPKAQNKG